MTFPILTTTQEATLNANLPNWIYYFNSYFKQVQKIFLDIAWLQPIIYCWKSLQEEAFFSRIYATTSSYETPSFFWHLRNHELLKMTTAILTVV